MKKELFYVAASRGRESVTVVTSDRELLRESVARSGARQSASELARRAQWRPGLQRGEQRGLASARRQARCATIQAEWPERTIKPAREQAQRVTREGPVREYQEKR